MCTIHARHTQPSAHTHTHTCTQGQSKQKLVTDTVSDSVQGSKGITGQKQLSTERRRARQWGTFTLLKRTLRGTVEAACPENTHTGCLAHCWTCQIMIPPLSLSFSPPQSLFLFSLSPSSLPLSPSPSIWCALWYHPNHNLIFTNGIPTEPHDVPLWNQAQMQEDVYCAWHSPPSPVISSC